MVGVTAAQAATRRRLVLASNNAKKLRELQALFGALPVELIAQGALGVAEAEEPHRTFVENALAKARHAAAATGEAAIADDSGLCVDALGGEPGVASAHWAGLVPDQGEREATRRVQDAANNALLLQRLHGAADRRARFVSVLVAVRSADDPEPLVAFGRWDGEILDSAQGQGGFGYDPLLFIPALGASVAQLPPDVKNGVSHRAQAAAGMVVMLRQAWRLDEPGRMG
jgi:XTP/dITP diphosphohydrolase